jgi:perosamine synthetase
LSSNEPELQAAQLFRGERWPIYTLEAMHELVRAVNEQKFIEFGKNEAIEDVERAFADSFGCKYAVAMNSGTSALYASYLGSGLKHGDRVLCPVYTFYATVTSLLPLGLVPVLVDVDPLTLNIDFADARRKAEAGAKAIVVTHNWGNEIGRLELDGFRRETGVIVIEDISHLGGRVLRGGRAEAGDSKSAQMLAMSAGARKVISGGSGGFLLTNSEWSYREVLRWSQPKRIPADVRQGRQYQEHTLGLNFRMNPLSAVLIRDNLRNAKLLEAVWSSVIRDVEAAIAGLGEYILPLASTSTLWYKIPVRLPQSDSGARELKRSLEARFGVSVDQVERPFPFAIPELMGQAGELPHWRELMPQLRTIDLSREVGGRLRGLAPYNL